MNFSTEIVIICLFALGIARGQLVVEDVVDDIHSHQGDVDQIIDYLTIGSGKNNLYRNVAEFADRFGPRFIGTPALWDAIVSLRGSLDSEGFDNVHVENFTHPSWRRGREVATLLEPRQADLAILGLFFTVATPPGGLEAEAIVVNSYAELTERASEAVGKIVVFNNRWSVEGIGGYSEASVYRTLGAAAVAAVGGAAALMRSAASASIYSPHTGVMNYAGVPGACITVEDAEMLQRMQDRGQTIRIKLEMEDETLADDTSGNLVAEIVGSKYPEQLVIVTGHMDSMDIGQGAMDNAGGMFTGIHVLRTVKALGFQPKRTIRFLATSAEEIGGFGSLSYYDNHVAEVPNVAFLMNADGGVFKPKGIDLMHGSGLALYLVEEVMSLVARINATQVTGRPLTPAVGAYMNISWASLATHNEHYFDYHHTRADTPLVLNPDDMDLSCAVWTALAYVLADIEETLPLTGEYPQVSSAPTLVVPGLILVLNCWLLRQITIDY